MFFIFSKPFHKIQKTSKKQKNCCKQIFKLAITNENLTTARMIIQAILYLLVKIPEQLIFVPLATTAHGIAALSGWELPSHP